MRPRPLGQAIRSSRFTRSGAIEWVLRVQVPRRIERCGGISARQALTRGDEAKMRKLATTSVGPKGEKPRGWRAARSFAQADEGVSAVEFALLAPMLIFGLLATVDLGLAFSESMTIDHVLRAGAQSATEDIGVAAVDRVLRTTAMKNFPLAATAAAGDDASLALSVRRFCSCSEEPAAAVACLTTCAHDTPTQIFYDLSGEKTYSGLILPRFPQSKALQVQVR